MSKQSFEEELRQILTSRTLGQHATDCEGNILPVNWRDSPVIDYFVEEIKLAIREHLPEPRAKLGKFDNSNEDYGYDLAVHDVEKGLGL